MIACAATPLGRSRVAERPSGAATWALGTVVEQLDKRTLLVEFSDDTGRAYAVAPCPSAELLVLHCGPKAA